MSEGLRALRREIRRHNRHCWLAAGLSLFLAWLAWLFFYAVFAGLSLLFETIRHGESATFPSWLLPAAATLALVLLGWGIADARDSKFRLPRDRPIIGWHLLKDFLLIPPRLTLAIFENIGTRIPLSRQGCEVALQILEAVDDAGTMPVHHVGALFADPALGQNALEALQLLGWVDLHAGKEEWFYRIRSSREQELATWRGRTIDSVVSEPQISEE